MNFNTYASLVIFFIIPAFFCFGFWTRNHIYYTSVSCVWFLLPYACWQYNWEWKPSKLELSISFSSLREVPEKVGHSTIWEMAWQLKLSSLCFVLWFSTLFQPMTARVISELNRHEKSSRTCPFLSTFVYFEIFTRFCKLFSHIPSVFKSWITLVYVIQTAPASLFTREEKT